MNIHTSDDLIATIAVVCFKNAHPIAGWAGIVLFVWWRVQSMCFRYRLWLIKSRTTISTYKHQASSSRVVSVSLVLKRLSIVVVDKDAPTISPSIISSRVCYPLPAVMSTYLSSSFALRKIRLPGAESGFIRASTRFAQTAFPLPMDTNCSGVVCGVI